MKDSPSPPPAPDPTQTAQAQSSSNIATAIANARLNRVNQQTPWGSITYSQGQPDANGVPTYSSQITLSPEQQALLSQQQERQYAQNAIAQQYLGQVTGKPLDFSHLSPLNERGQMYQGAVNAGPPPAANPLPQIPTSQGQPPQGQPGNTGNPPIDPSVLTAIQQWLSGQPGQPTGQPTGGQPATGQPQGGNSLLTPGYQDYLKNFQDFSQRDESGTSPAGKPMSESDFNALSDKQKWGLLGMGTAGVNTPYGDSPFGLTINSSDPRYSQLSPQFQKSGDSALQFSFDPTGKGLSSEPVQRFGDPNLVHSQGGVTGYSVGNETPDWFNYVNQKQAGWNPLIFAPILGAAAYAALGAGAAGAAGADSGAAAVPEGTGIYTGGGFVDDPAFVAAGGGQIPADAATVAGTGAPVVDNSIAATHPSIFQQMGQNFTSGHGLLGLNAGQRAGIGLLPSILRALPQRNSQTGGH